MSAGYFGGYFGALGGSGGPPPSSHYGSEAGMRKMIKLSYDIFGDVDNDGTLDSDVTEDVLARSDAYIKRFIRANGVTPPEPETLSAIDANDAESLRDIGDHMGVWFIAQDRGLLETAPRQSSSANAIAGGVGGYKTYADEELAKLVTILSSDATEDEVIPAMQAIVPVREQECVNPWGWTL